MVERKEVIFMTNEKGKVNKYIDKLLQMGIFKINNRQLYECSEKEMKQVLLSALSRNRKIKAK
jgi:hypothetical protein